MREIVYEGNYITASEEKIHGHVYERVQLRPGVQVIPYRDDARVLLMKESRAHETKPRWKLVSGWIDKNEKSPLDHAKEELAEELGYKASDWQMLLKEDDKNFTISYDAHFFVCTGLEKFDEVPDNPDEGCEVLDHAWFSFDEIFDLLESGEIVKDNTILVALCYIRQQLKNKKD